MQNRQGSPVRRLLLVMLTSVGLVFTANGTASAATTFNIYGYSLNPDGRQIEVLRDGSYRGQGLYNADPQDGVQPVPGDAFRACDSYADGKGIEIHRRVGGGSWQVMSSTRGKSSPWCDLWNSANLAEGTAIDIRACIVDGDSATCSAAERTYA
ncbi:hypothetical protein [Streptomyces sp. NPDC056600]|uniref:hypothetical protein n=1 Tax=Streptomyces sp. NPDC056600 TaxID=3345874 RepID=UPI0036BADA65